MKLPKHRANVFLVERRILDADGLHHNYTVVGVFPTVEGADEYAGACKQNFIERGYVEDDFTFSVIMSTYYDA